MIKDRATVVGADLNVNSKNLSRRSMGSILGLELITPIKQGKQRRTQHQRATVGHPRLNDQIGASAPDNLLQGNHVLRVLNDGATHPFKVVSILMQARVMHPLQRLFPKRVISAKTFNVLRDFLLEKFKLIH